MFLQTLQALGGLGLFLLGMLLMTDGLRSLAGDALNRVLYRFTRSPLSGAVTGAGLAALVQSSSATTVAVVGFVSAELLTFSQALGVMFGANIGTTATGWLVTLFGFELDVGNAMWPLLFAGVLLRLFGRGRLRSIGWAVAGFALLFLGLEQLRTGLEAFEGAVTPVDLPPDTWGGRLLLVLIGIVVTLVTQSSSAGIALVLSALAAGAISFPQAAAMVIGMDIGTTSTTAIATLGGSAQTRRTGYSHVVFNFMTGTVALVILDPYISAVESWTTGGTAAHASIALVGFHSTSNTLGVALVLPFTKPFARLMQRIVPEDELVLTRRLDRSLLKDAAAASLALLAAVREIAREPFEILDSVLNSTAGNAAARLHEVDLAIDAARSYAGKIGASPGEGPSYRCLLASMHCLDHLDRLVERCQMKERIETVVREERLHRLSEELRAALHETLTELPEGSSALRADRLKEVRDVLKRERHPYRSRVLEDVPASRLGIDEAIRRLDAVRWLHRTAYHTWRIAHHLEEVQRPAPGEEQAPRRAEAVPEED